MKKRTLLGDIRFVLSDPVTPGLPAAAPPVDDDWDNDPDADEDGHRDDPYCPHCRAWGCVCDRLVEDYEDRLRGDDCEPIGGRRREEED